MVGGQRAKASVEPIGLPSRRAKPCRRRTLHTVERRSPTFCTASIDRHCTVAFSKHTRLHTYSQTRNISLTLSISYSPCVSISVYLCFYLYISLFHTQKGRNSKN